MRRLTILLATVAAFMFAFAAQAMAETLTITGISGNGAGEVTSAEGINGPNYAVGVPFFIGEPPIECSYASPGPMSGECSNEMEEFEEENLAATALEAVPAPGSVFAGWTESGGNVYEPFPGCYSNKSEAVDVGGNESNAIWQRCFANTELGSGANVSVTAVFNKAAPLTLNVEEGTGTVVSNPAGLECTGAAPHSCTAETFAEGTKVVLTASPAAGYAFKSWKGCDVGGVNGRQCTVTLSSAKTVGAKFYKVWSLEGKKSIPNGIFSTSPGGVNCGYGCISSSANYKEGALMLKAKPAKNFHFVEFTGGTGSASSCNGVTTETCSIAAFSSDSSIEEVYAENAKNTLTVSKEGGGQGFIKTKPTNINCGYTCTAAKAEFFAGETVPVTVTLNKGTTSVTWTTSAGTCTGNALSCEVPMSAAHSLVAKFE